MIFTALLLLCVVAFYFYNKNVYNYWKKKGVKHSKPILFLGTNAKNFLMQLSRSEIIEKVYWDFPNEKVVGFYNATRPELIIRDPELVKNVLMRDFTHFTARGFAPDKSHVETFLKNLFFVEGDLWKSLRTRMTPAFTSGKLRAMFPLIVERAEKLEERAMSAVKLNKPIDARDLIARYATEFIAVCGFGFENDALKDDDCEFRQFGYDIFNPPFMQVIQSILKMVFPKIFRRTKYFAHIEPRAHSMVNELQRIRNYKPVGKHDFLDMLLEYKQKGPIEVESIEKTGTDGKALRFLFELDDDLIVAQILVFFAAGFETSSSATSYTLHELAFNPEVQQKVHAEIDQVLARHNNKLSYDAVKEMTYLAMTFKEGMRKFPSLGYLFRECTKKYTFKELGLTIDEGVKVLVSVQGMHMDPKYWDKPEEFRPERFSKEEFTAEQKDIYNAFGSGPRNCIGERLGTMQSLAGLAVILSKFTVEPAANTLRHPPVVHTSDLVQNVKNGIPLMFKERIKHTL
ncbi:hypothetical protein ACJJTC_007394 [Scirpophaga incertulas]